MQTSLQGQCRQADHPGHAMTMKSLAGRIYLQSMFKRTFTLVPSGGKGPQVNFQEGKFQWQSRGQAVSIYKRIEVDFLTFLYFIN